MVARTLLMATLLLLLSALAARADTTFDCPRFYLKWDPKAEEMKCVGKTKKRGDTAAQLKRQQQAVAQKLRTVRALLNKPIQTSEDVDRIRRLMADIRVRIREIRSRTRKLLAQQKTFTAGVLAEQRQRIAEQERMTERLIAKQKQLTEQLLARQRERTRQLTDKGKARSRPTPSQR